jgi:hypothetical protein
MRFEDKVDQGFGCFFAAWIVGVILVVGFWGTVLYLAWRLVMANT